MPVFNPDIPSGLTADSVQRTPLTPRASRYPDLFGTGIPAIIVPTLITSASAFCGLAAINFAIIGSFESAVLFVLLAGLFDCMDGQAARMLKCTSDFGMELDSLVDFLSFGVAPGFILYLWVLQETPMVGFCVATIYILCCAYRLARFNVTALKPKEERPLEGAYFQGIPAPAGGACALLPLMLSFATDYTWASAWYFDAGVMIAAGLMMVSKVPTFSSKAILPRLRPAVGFPLALLFGASLAYAGWSILVIVMLIYIASLPLARVHYRAAASGNHGL